MIEYINNNRYSRDEEHEEELYSMPNEGYCSPEFPEGCIFSDLSDL